MTGKYYPDVPYTITTTGLTGELPSGSGLSTGGDAFIEVDLGFTVNIGGYSTSTAILCLNGYVGFGWTTAVGDFSNVLFNSEMDTNPIFLKPIFAALMYDVGFGSTGSEVVYYGQLVIDGVNAWRAVWTDFGEEGLTGAPAATFALTVFETSSGYHMEAHVDYLNLLDTANYYGVQVGLGFGPGRVDRVWRGQVNIAPGLYVFKTGGKVRALRQFPREDGLGTSSAPRQYPRPRSVQSGFRKAGPTYL